MTVPSKTIHPKFATVNRRQSTWNASPALQEACHLLLVFFYFFCYFDKLFLHGTPVLTHSLIYVSLQQGSHPYEHGKSWLKLFLFLFLPVGIIVVAPKAISSQTYNHKQTPNTWNASPPLQDARYLLLVFCCCCYFDKLFIHGTSVLTHSLIYVSLQQGSHPYEHGKSCLKL